MTDLHWMTATQLVAAYRDEGSVAGRSRRISARPHRSARRAHQRDLPHRSGNDARPSARLRRALDERRTARPARRRARRDQRPRAVAKAGRPCAARKRSTANQPWEHDAPSVARLREHGAVFIGKTTTPEFGWKGTNDSPLTGVTRNPWNLEQDAGRLERRGRGGTRRRLLPARDRHRRRRLDPHPGKLLRRLRPEADLRPRRRLAGKPVHDARARRPDVAHRRRQRAVPERDLRTRRARLVPAAVPAGGFLLGPGKGHPRRENRLQPAPRLGRARRSAKSKQTVARAVQRFTELGAHVDEADPPGGDPIVVLQERSISPARASCSPTIRRRNSSSSIRTCARSSKNRAR